MRKYENRSRNARITIDKLLAFFFRTRFKVDYNDIVVAIDDIEYSMKCFAFVNACAFDNLFKEHVSFIVIHQLMST